MNCNYDEEYGLLSCTANDGEPCDACLKRAQAEHDYWRRLWEVASPEERDPEAYRQGLIDCGRGHLVKRDGYR